MSALEAIQLLESYVRDFPCEPDLNKRAEDIASTLMQIRHVMSELVMQKEQLEEQLDKLLDQEGIEGSRTYTAGRYKVVLKKSSYFYFDKKSFASKGDMLPQEYNPVSIKEEFHLDERKLCEIETIAPDYVKEMLSEFFVLKNSKLNVTVGLRS